MSGLGDELVPIDDDVQNEVSIDSIRFVDPGIEPEERFEGQSARPAQQFSPPGNLELYNVRYRRIGIEDWHLDAPFISEHARFWASRDEFQPQNFSKNIQSLSSLWNSWGFCVAFYVNMLQLFCAFGISIVDGGIGPSLCSEIHASILVPILSLLLTFAFGTLAPKSELRFGTLFGIFATIAAGLLCAFVGFHWAIVFCVAVLLSGILFFFLSRYNIEYSTKIYMYVNQSFFKKAVNLCFLVAFIVFVLILDLLHFYIAVAVVFRASVVSFVKVAIFCFYVVVQWWTMLAIGNALYMTASDASIQFYFLAGTAYERKNPIIESAWKSITKNFGICAKAALLLPFFEVPMVIARFDENRTKRCGMVHRIVCWVRVAAIEFAKRVDSVFCYPSRYGLIYSAVFNVGMKEGCKRYAENCSKYYVNLLNEECSIGSMLCFRSFNAAVFCGLVDAGLSRVLGFSSDWMHGFFGFFTAFSIFHLYRCATRGVYEGLFVAFSEEPARLQRISSELYTVFESKFNEAVTKRRNILDEHFD